MLLGSYPGVLSPKRRVAIPKKLLTELGKTVIIAKWYEDCIVVVSKATWEKLMGRLTGRNQTVTKNVRDTDRFILASAYEATPDAQGRVVLPESLAGYAHLAESVVFLGLGDRVELWNKDEWAKRELYVAKNATEFIEEIAQRKNDKDESV